MLRQAREARLRQPTLLERLVPRQEGAEAAAGDERIGVLPIDQQLLEPAKGLNEGAMLSVELRIAGLESVDPVQGAHGQSRTARIAPASLDDLLLPRRSDARVYLLWTI